jgi:DNA-directed RNA polymerase specialized sigma24 family protein
LLTERHTAQRPSEGASLAEIEAVYRAHYARFIAVAAMLCRDPELGRDAVQDGFASAIRSRASFRGGSLEGWLWRIVVNAAHSAARRPRRVLDMQVGTVGSTANAALTVLRRKMTEGDS